MIKKILILFFFPITLVSGVIVKPVDVSAKLKEFVFSPLVLNEPSKFIANIASNQLHPLTLSITISNEIFTAPMQIYKKTFTSVTKETIIYDNSFTASNNILTIQVETKKASDSFVTSTYVPVSKCSFYYHDFSQTLESYDSLLIYKDGRWSAECQKINFSGFDDYYVPDYYHKLDPSDFKFKIASTTKEMLTNPEITFEISNYNGFLDNFGSKEYFRFPMKLVAGTKGNYSLDFDTTFYVEPHTLEMSPVYKSGFVRTKYLYFPRNEMRAQEEYECGIILNGLGIDRYSIPYKFRCKALINTMGDCRNSEYCIVNN